VVLKKTFQIDPGLFLHFCDGLPFEEDMTLYLNNFEFLSPKDILHQV
jgi:hypothetical protein